MRITTLLTVSIVVLCSCSQRMIETSLYFGQSRPDGSTVTEEEWNEFKNAYILKVFKKGATTIPVSGNWYDPDQRHLIQENTYIVVSVYKQSDSLSHEIDNLRDQYKKLHRQQSVLRIDRKVKASF